MGLYGDEYFTESGKITNIGKYVSKLIEWMKGKNKNKKDVKKLTEKARNYSDEYNNLSNDEKQKMKSLYNQKVSEFNNIIKAEEKRMLTDKDYKAKIRKAIDDAFEDGYLDVNIPYEKAFYKSKLLPVLVSENLDDYCWKIIDEDQSICTVCSFICQDLAKYLEKETGYEIGTGDGDEGCIYPDSFYDYFQFYTYYADEIRDNKED